MLEGLKKGDKVVKLILGGGMETACIQTIAGVCNKRKLISVDSSHVKTAKDIEDDGVGVYRMSDGRAVADYIPGFTSRLVYLED